ncbi:hypothetical protein EDC63_11932 [Sulfurirhabdus autotrophica]|uniref:Uncharacterized protein n=1 Tax=Sulfurirhabdus autotrophica TaxID=1706046 RepID=A0A4R3XST2_9PROT|nr:hypothetical protein EDC63_11932 [Sulfurirhabdus autotrophica]
MFPAPKINHLNTRDRWLLYFVLTSLPGLNIFIWFGFTAAVVFELLMWIPQQRLFDVLELSKTLPFYTK